NSDQPTTATWPPAAVICEIISTAKAGELDKDITCRRGRPPPGSTEDSSEGTSTASSPGVVATSGVCSDPSAAMRERSDATRPLRLRHSRSPTAEPSTPQYR